MGSGSTLTVRRMFAMAAVIAVVLLIAELAVRVRADVLPARAVWANPEMQAKELELDRLQDRVPASVVFLGSSAMDVAIDPSALRTPPSGGLRYNAAAMGSTMQITSTWARYVVVPTVRPDVVVLGVTSRELNGSPEQDRIDAQFVNAPAVRHLLGMETLLERAERRAEEWSALFKYRTVLRERRAVGALFGLNAVKREFEDGEIVAPDGQVVAYLGRQYRLRPGAELFFTRGTLANFHVGAEQRAFLGELLSFLESRTRHIVVLNMPTTQVYVDYHPRRRADWDDYRTALKQEASRVGATYLEGGIWPLKYFADPAHLNERGSIRLTRIVDDALGRVDDARDGRQNWK